MSHYTVVLDKLVQLVMNIGVSRSYENIKGATKYNNEDNDINKSANIKLGLVRVMGGELPEHSVISCLYDTVGASNGWRSPADTTKIMRLKYGISPVNKSTDDDLTVAIVVGYLLVKRSDCLENSFR